MSKLWVIDRTTTLATTILVIVILMIIIGLLASAIINGMQWLVPPSVIAIGDETTSYKKQLKLRESIFWTILVGGIVGIIVNIITK